MSNFKNKLIWKCYTEADAFIETLDDVISELSITKKINGGDSEFTFVLNRKIDDFDENTSVKFNNRIKVYLQNSYNPAGTKLVAYGYISSYKPILRGKDEKVEVTCLSAISKLSNDFYRSGTAAAASDLGVELTSKRVDEMMEAIINHYRSTEANSMLSNDYTNADSTTDNAGGAISFTHRFFNMKHLDAMREASKFLPRNKTGGYWFYWRISTDGKLYVKNVSTTADHTFKIGKHIKEITGNKTIEGMVNRVYFWNEKGTLDPDYLKLTSDDLTSQGSHDIIAEYITDSKITNLIAANLLASSKVYDKKDPKVQIKVTLNNEYDLTSISPGDTCQILNLKNNPYAVSGDGVLIIHNIKYTVDNVVLELSEPQDNYEDIIEAERQRLDKEMTWFGYISQSLTAAQLGPADRTWSTNIEFNATSGADAYRQIDWTTGTVYLPAGTSGTAGRRVVDLGNTGYMTADTDYYIYLDEGTFNTSASNSDSNSSCVAKQGGDTLTDSGKAWSNDQYKGYIVTVGGETKIIKSNTATVLTIEDRWTVADQTGAYTIKKMSFDVTNDKEVISDLTKIIFSNVRAAVDAGGSYATDAEATNLSEHGHNIMVNGYTQISANTVTTSQLNFTPLESVGAGGEIIATINASTEGGGTLRIDASKIHITGSVTFAAGWAAVTNAESNINVLNTTNAPSQANADQTSANGQNYSWVTGSKPPTNADHTADIVSAMAYESMVGLAKLDTTIVVGGYVKTSLLTATNIQAGTLSSRTVQTKSSGARVVIGGGTEWIKFYDASAEQVILYASGGDFIIYGSQSGSDILIKSGSSAEVSIYKGGNIKLATSAAGISISGSLAITGTVDGVDIASHASNSNAHHSQSHSHSSHTGIGASDHHNNLSNGYNITPSRCTANGTGTGSSSSFYGYNLGLSNGMIYKLTTAVAQIMTTKIIFHKPIRLDLLSSTPGAASSWKGYMYFDNSAVNDICFSNGTNWYKVTATIR